MFLKMLEKIFGKALKIAVKKPIINFPQFYVSNDRISIFGAALSLHNLNLDLLHERLNNHYKEWSYKKKRHKKIKTSRKSL